MSHHDIAQSLGIPPLRRSFRFSGQDEAERFARIFMAMFDKERRGFASALVLAPNHDRSCWLVETQRMADRFSHMNGAFR